ncbi:dual specificity protein phosphatase family protein [Microvirga sp. G4-2]|uniref:dual specificity protein phosphatase family protein n=1 Tax=Microvirga sp. G4-2 TaxID=3434467 RepID=UPI004043A906
MVIRWLQRAAASFAGLSLVFGVFLGHFQLNGNFHPVVIGEVYRSAQPTPEALARYVKEQGIRSVINLRGNNAGADWYDAEVASARAQGVALYDFGMSARKQIDQQRAQQLIDLMNKAEKPVLIHCQGGADRSGLASALYLAAIAKAGEEVAESQMSLRYGHISLPVLASYAMDKTFEALEPWLGFNNS